MRTATAAVFLLSFLAFPLLAQDPELAQRTPEQLEALLRSSCYCINCTPTEVPQLVEAKCQFVRWGGYAFIPARKKAESNYRAELDATFNRFAAFARDYKAATRQLGVVEFVIPEIITAGIENVPLGDTHTELKALGIIPNLPETHSFKFDDIYVKQWTDEYWDLESEGFERNGVPSLAVAPGQLWAAYLALRAIRAGADAIGFAQPHFRVETTDNLEFLVRKIRRLVPAGRPPLMFGISASHGLTRGPSPFPVRLFIDYTKVKIDIDRYTTVGGVRGVSRYNGGPVPCALLANNTLNAELLPATDPNMHEYMCMIATNQPARAPSIHLPVGPKFDDANRFGLRVLMELDGSQKCMSGNRRVWYYLGAGDGLTSTCYAQVRHGLPTTMYFLSRSAPARRLFLRYMNQLAKDLTAMKGYGVYFPLPIKVDQNEMAFVLQRSGCEVNDSCGDACLTKPYARPKQVQKIPGCPSALYPRGRHCSVAKNQYFVRDCLPDFDTVKTLLPPLP